MTASTTANSVLDRECSVFSIYLIGQAPCEYVKERYRAAHQTGSILGPTAQPAEDFLVRVARIAPWSAKIIDGYTRVFRPFSTVRKKLVLLLAILESCAPTHAYLDAADANSIPVLFLRFVKQFLTFVLIAAVGVLLILPAELMLRAKAKRVALQVSRNG